jgi:hypothetical protein
MMAVIPPSFSPLPLGEQNVLFIDDKDFFLLLLWDNKSGAKTFGGKHFFFFFLNLLKVEKEKKMFDD